MDFLADPIFTEFGRSDFIGGIDNEALDFGHLEQFIHVTASAGDGEVSTRLSTGTLHEGGVVPTTTININNNGLIQSHLPESPPDSGSEPPFSPVDLQGLTLTSRATSTNDALSSRAPSIYSNHFPRELKEIENKLKDDSVHNKPASHLHTLTLVDGGDHQQQHNHHNIHDHHQYVEHNNQPSLLLAATHQLHHQSMQHAESEDSRHERGNENPDTLLAMQSHTNKNIHVNSIEEISDVGSQRSAYNRQVMMMTPQQLLTSSIIPSDVYMGTPAPMIETPTAVAPNNRKRKLLQVDCCTSMLTIKPEPGASLSPLCQQNPDSPISIKLQKNGCTGAEIGSPSLSSLSPAATSLSLSNDNNSLDGIGAGTPNGASFVGSNATDSSSESTPMQCIRFSPFQQHSWHTLCDQSLQEITIAHYRVDADKGFNFSVSDDAFVCQKKNHFQITCHARLQGDAEFVKTPTGLEKIKSFYLHFYGVKLEAPNQTIRVEQSQSDRSKKPFYPVPIDLQSHLVSKVTVGRLHFSETTNNNMRKKGRPNPEQRYFQLVVGLHVHTLSGHFPIVSQGSERIIVRASNPGQFESDVELCWQRGITPESIFHAGRVGINTDRPDESLVIHGNLKVSGHIIQPSDSRAKQEISELDTAVQLRNLQKIRIVRYRYEPEFAMHSGLKSAEDNEEIVDTGVIAQEVREVLPDAVQEAGSIVLPSGQVIDNFLLVNKDRILMENIGAVKELCKVTGSLETRIEQLEKINNRLMKMQEFDRNKKRFKHLTDDSLVSGADEICSNRTIQMMIIILVIIMATCLVAVSTLYFVEHSKQRYMKRYDRYDISHHLVSHDAILINSNNNDINPRNTNYNGYHTNKSGKILLHSHMPRPPTTPPTPPPIHSQQSSNFDTTLFPQPLNIPISVIQASYPSTRAGSGVIFHGNTDSEAYNGVRGAPENEKTNDELPIGKDKSPVPSISTMSTSHINNKTGSSKNKAKWPLSETVTISPSITSAYNINEEPIEESLNVSETSSEKVADSIPLPQDFENNSIDGSDALQKTESRINQNGVLPIDHGIVGSTTKNKAHELGNSVRNLAETTIGVGAVKIESTVDSSPTSSASSLFVVYKNVQSKNINDTVSQAVNFTMETPSITNKSRGIDTEDADLQYLGNSNDSDDQSLSDITTIPVVVKTFSLAPIGLPDHCVKIKREEISNCQSACFEDTNNLPSQNKEGEIRRRHLEIPASNNTTLVVSTGGSVTALSSNLKSYPKPQTNKSSESTSSMEQSQIEEAKVDQGNESIEQENIETDTNQPRKDSTRKIDSIEKQSANEPRTSSDCFSITPWLQADTFNVSLGCEEICHNGGSSLNISYEIPLSKYLKETNVELYFVAPVNLHWTVCSNKEKTKLDGSSVTNALSNGKVFQKNQNVSIFYLIIPGHGHFERLIELRAAMDSTKNLCREEADETKVFLQYNIRILRDCD